MESLIKELEEQIADNLKFLQSVSWGSHLIGKSPSNRGSDDFIDKITTILVVKLGFSEGMKMAFEVKYYLDQQEKTHEYLHSSKNQSSTSFA